MCRGGDAGAAFSLPAAAVCLPQGLLHVKTFCLGVMTQAAKVRPLSSRDQVHFLCLQDLCLSLSVSLWLCECAWCVCEGSREREHMRFQRALSCTPACAMSKAVSRFVKVNGNFQCSETTTKNSSVAHTIGGVTGNRLCFYNLYHPSLSLFLSHTNTNIIYTYSYSLRNCLLYFARKGSFQSANIT